MSKTVQENFIELHRTNFIELVYLFLEHVDEDVVFVPSKRLIGFVEDTFQDASSFFDDGGFVRSDEGLHHLDGQV